MPPRQPDDRALQTDTMPPRCAACGAEGCMELGALRYRCQECGAYYRPPLFALEDRSNNTYKENYHA